ncbi:MAG: L-ornithine N5-monooxygenase [Gammaproteobacteria bacterium]|jgi:L-ornithine N5-oxygenase|nr:L-ornithine N5-monooxygenase [Gammaproteobacteria bacterium]
MTVNFTMPIEPLRRHYNVLGLGFGPSNIALAIALEESGADFTAHFIESAPDSTWQAGMLLGGSDIQNHPMRDLVTPRNPKSHYTFINYLHQVGRLYDFLNLGIIYALRKDYSEYIRWVASHFAHMVSYHTRASQVSYDGRRHCWSVTTNNGSFTADALIVATGRTRNIPEPYREQLGERVFHFCDYGFRMRELEPELSSIAVIGSAQSAVELHLDLMKRLPKADIHAIHRSYSMRQKDTSPFSDKVYFPEFIDYFCNANPEAREELQRQLRPTNYNTADGDVLHQLYLAIYEERLDGRNRHHLRNNTVVDRVSADADGVTLDLRERYLDSTETIRVDAVVLATGFFDIGAGEGKEAYPPLLAGIAPGLARSDNGALQVERDYQVRTQNGLPLFLNGLCESSHGLGDAGSFSLLSLRSSEILRSLTRHFSTPRLAVHASVGERPPPIQRTSANGSAVV